MEFVFQNRQSLEKSHEMARSKSIDCEMSKKLLSAKMKSCVQSCVKLIESCKEAQKEEKLIKEVKMFTIFNKEFAKKCERKYNSIDRIKKAL